MYLLIPPARIARLFAGVFLHNCIEWCNYINMKRKRSIVLFDGSNFYFKLKDLRLHNLLDFNLSRFVADLSHDSILESSYYYVGEVKTDTTKKSKELHSLQQKLLAHLKKHNIRYTLGYLLKSNGTFHEKGVDVHIATDILVAAYEDTADHIIVISSDTDLIPAILRAKKQGKTVEYIGFKHMASKAMVRNCSKYRLFTKEELKKYIVSQPKKKSAQKSPLS